MSLDVVALKKAKENLETLIAPIFVDDVFELFFGLAEDKMGWWLITTDYPEFCIHFLGEFYEAAEQTIRDDWLEEDEEEE